MMMGMGSPMSSNPPNNNLFTTTTAAAAALRLHRRVHLGFLLRSSLKNLPHLSDVPLMKDICHERALQFAGFNGFQWSFNDLSPALMGFSFFSGDGNRSSANDGIGKSNSKRTRGDLFDGRVLTSILLATNVLVYIAQSVSGGDIVFWGAKINSLISRGQLWRLATSAFLHANLGHLMMNCYSLNSVGPSVEKICGPKRFLAIYMTSAITSAAMSYWFCKNPAVGASGAIFGLVGSFAVFVLRHRDKVKGTEGQLKHIAKVILINMAIGMLSQGIDNWGHAGGLIGGAAASWFLGPAWEFESLSPGGRRVITDKAPIFSIIKRQPK